MRPWGSAIFCRPPSRQYAVDATSSFADALSECRHPKHAVLIVDIALTTASLGIELIRSLRTGGDQRPVVATSGLHDAELPSRAYEAGADAFVQKGLWTVREIRAVLARLLGRTAAAARIDHRVDGILLPDDRFNFAGATIDPRDMTAAFPGGGIQHLNPKEIGILHVFATRAGRLVRRTEILAHVWGPSAIPTSKTLDTYLVRLRRAYEAGGLDLVRTLRAKPKVGWWVTEGPTS